MRRYREKLESDANGPRPNFAYDAARPPELYKAPYNYNLQPANDYSLPLDTAGALRNAMDSAHQRQAAGKRRSGEKRRPKRISQGSSDDEPEAPRRPKGLSSEAEWRSSQRILVRSAARASGDFASEASDGSDGADAAFARLDAADAALARLESADALQVEERVARPLMKKEASQRAAALDARAAEMLFRPRPSCCLGTFCCCVFCCCRPKQVKLVAGITPVAVRILQLHRRDLQKLLRQFQKYATKGGMHTRDLFDLVDVEEDAFYKVCIDQMVFRWADLDQSGSLDFDEFVLAACVVCTMSDTELLQQIFDLADADGSGSLSKAEVLRLASSRAQSSTAAGLKNPVLAAFGESEVKQLRFPEFYAIMIHVPRMWMPVKALRLRFQEKTLGPSKWADVNARYRQLHNRKNDHDSEFRPVIMKIHKHLFPDAKSGAKSGATAVSPLDARLEQRLEQRRLRAGKHA